MQIDLLDYVLPLLVFLASLVCLGVGPTHERLAAFAEDVGDTVRCRNKSERIEFCMSFEDLQ